MVAWDNNENSVIVNKNSDEEISSDSQFSAEI